MWPAAILFAAVARNTCPPGPAFWMPHEQIPDGSTAPLPLEPALSIACCGGVLGATPAESHHVTNLYPHNGVVYAILKKNPAITCPPNATKWNAQPDRGLAARAATTRDVEQRFEGYFFSENTDCIPFRSADGTAGQCAALCTQMPECELFSFLPPRNCRLCADKRRARESSGYATHVKKNGAAAPPAHHPLVLAGAIVCIAVVMAVGATIYASKDT